MTIDLYLPKRKRFDKQQHKFQLIRKNLEAGSKKFWNQRYSLFSRFDEGVFMNQELWYSVTPESVAVFLAKFIQVCDPDIKCVLDVFCGGGGNTIQFARKFDKCIGVDFNQENLYCTENNCYVYGVEEKTELIFGDWMNMDEETLKYLEDEVDFVFASPPWGGTGYKNKNMFDLDYLQPLPIREILISFFKISKNVCLFLPRNSNLIQLSQVTKELLGPDALCRVIYTYNEGFIKGLLVFFGDKFMPESVDRESLAEQNRLLMEQFQQEQEAIKNRHSENSQQVETNYEFEFANENFYDDPVEYDAATVTSIPPGSSSAVETLSYDTEDMKSTNNNEANLEGHFFTDIGGNDESTTDKTIQEAELTKDQVLWECRAQKKQNRRKRQQEQEPNWGQGKSKRGKKQRMHQFYDENGELVEKLAEVEESKSYGNENNHDDDINNNNNNNNNNNTEGDLDY